MSMNGTIPFLDLVTQHLQLEEELVSVFRSALKTAGFIGGPMVEDFEREFARFCDTKYSVGVASGTDALRFVLSAAGVGEGDLVVTVPNTFIATTEAISQTGALADFVDIDEHTYNMDPAKLDQYFETQCQLEQKSGVLLHRRTGKRIKAIVPVHLYGQMADMDPILALAEKYRLIVIEDACQAHGAEYFSKKEKRWRKAGSIGQAAAFSFYPGKNLGACGEAGAVTTNDETLSRKVKMLRDHGQAKKYHHDVEGYNGRLDAVQAGILAIKLRHLTEWNQARRGAAATYEELFGASTAELVLPFTPDYSRPVHHLYVIRTVEREQLKTTLAEAGIGTAIHYPVPLHLQNAYRGLGFKAGDFPVTERVAPEILSLPMFPGLRREDLARIVKETRKHTAQLRSNGRGVKECLMVALEL
jgi:dTDP-4-amino-4,6-dideoxygalactose transaminase